MQFLKFHFGAMNQGVDEPSLKKLKAESSSSMTGHAENKPKWSGFDKYILYQYLRKPQEYQDSIVFSNESCTVLKDAYPKASTHLLLIPSESFLDILEVRQLTPADLDKIQTLHAVARRIASERSADGSSFNIGYHAIPSLHPLHIHIISDDFDSPALKKKYHWNSFNTDYFVPIDLVESWLSSGKSADSQMRTNEEYEAMTSLPMKCNHCKVELKNIPTLKKHIAAGSCRGK